MRFAKIAFVLLLAAGAGGGAWYYWSAQAKTAAPLRSQTVALGMVEDTVSAVGTLQPLNYVDVGTQVSGQLKQIMVEIGNRVEKGQLLAQIDPTVYEARVAADQAQLLNLRAQIAEKTVQLGLAQKQYERQKKLLAERATSQDTHDIAEASTKTIAAQISALNAQTQQTESTLKGDLANLSYTKIYAPMTGTVIDINARQGQTLNANQSAPIVLRVADLDTMTVKTQVSEADVSRLKIGMPAYFTTLGQANRRRTGNLRQILPTPEVVNNVVLYSALFDVPNPQADLLPQMSAQVFFVVAHAENVPVVPMAALKAIPGSRNRFTARVLENGQPVERNVEIGANNRIQAEVRRGLQAGDELVVENQRGGSSGNRPSGGFAPPPRL